jgi:hypothetical protein
MAEGKSGFNSKKLPLSLARYTTISLTGVKPELQNAFGCNGNRPLDKILSMPSSGQRNKNRQATNTREFTCRIHIFFNDHGRELSERSHS